jgi:hypothetical protein
MKYINFFTWCLTLTMLTIFAGCKEDEKELNLTITEVKTLYSPNDNLSVKLKPEGSSSYIFEWSQALAEDGSLVMYEVAFDQENGDFSSPFYTVPSNGKGIETKLTLTHAELDKIAKLGGSVFFQKKKFKWTVFSAKGSNSKMALVSRKIELERPGGFDVLPSELYITGLASEGGTDVAASLKMKHLEDGVFEIYTKLSTGTYKFIDAQTSTANVYYVKDEAGTLKVSANGETTYAGADKIVRIKMNFNTLAVKIDEIKSVGLWYSVENSVKYTLPYVGSGVWKINVPNFTLTNAPWGGKEERHRYKVVVNEGVGDKDEWWGYKDIDSPGQDGQYGTAPDAYFHAYLVSPPNVQWDNTWKFDRPAVDGKSVDLLLKFTADAPYASEYIVH